MSIAYVFPGQGSQKPGMAQDLVEGSSRAQERMAEAHEILGFDIAKIMFEGTKEELQQTSVTQPAIFLHSVLAAEDTNAQADAAMMAGHSLGEFSALVAAGALSFAEGLKLVSVRAQAMQKACDAAPSTMAAIVGLDDSVVEQLCTQVKDVVPANYNSPGQLVVSGSQEGIAQLVEMAKEAGAKLARELPVNGAFHSPFMEPARAELAEGIEAAAFREPMCPVYQNVDAKPHTAPDEIRANLISQLTAAVRWTQTVRNMQADGAETFTELGPGNVLSGLVKRILG